MSKTTKDEFLEIAALINKRLEGFDFVLLSSGSRGDRKLLYVSNMNPESRVELVSKSSKNMETEFNRNNRIKNK